MTGSSFAHEWSGWEPRGRKQHQHHRHHHQHGEDSPSPKDLAREMARQWAFARGKASGRGRPTPEEIEQLIALRRLRGGAFGGHGPFGPRGRGRGSRRRRGDVRLAVLRLLAEQPANGYQLMQVIEQRSGGIWRPSPGSMYPTLSQLEDEGLIRSTESEGSRLFEITDAGREHLQTRAGEPDPWEQDDPDEPSARDVKSAIAGIAAAAWQVAQAGDETQRARAITLLTQARRGLYLILAEDAPGDDEDTADDDTDTV